MLNRKEKRIMDFLRRQAIDVVPVKSSKLAAAIVFKNNIISVGNNSRRTHPFQAKYGKNPQAICLHAEINAIKNALNHLSPSDFKKSTIMIYRVKKTSNNVRKAEWVDGLAKPCEGCMRAIVEFDFKKVIYSTDENQNFVVAENPKDFMCK